MLQNINYYSTYIIMTVHILLLQYKHLYYIRYIITVYALLQYILSMIITHIHNYLQYIHYNIAHPMIVSTSDQIKTQLRGDICSQSQPVNSDSLFANSVTKLTHFTPNPPLTTRNRILPLCLPVCRSASSVRTAKKPDKQRF